MASASTRPILLFKKDRIVNSPGSAKRHPIDMRLSIIRSTIKGFP